MNDRLGLQGKWLQTLFHSPRRRALLPVAPVHFLLLPLWWLAGHWYEARLRAEERMQVARQVDAYGIALTNAVNRRFALLRGLRAFTEARRATLTGQPSPEFEVFAKILHSSAVGIRNFVVAPHGVNRYVYPLAGNEAALGHNLLQDPRPNVQADLKRTLASRQIGLSGPYELRQGGFGLVARMAIFEQEVFWGLVAMVLDMPPILHEAGLGGHPGGVVLAVRDGSGRVFFGSEGVFTAAPVGLSIELPEGHWELGGIPTGGWGVADWGGRRLFQGVGLIIVGLVVCIVYLVANRQARLVDAVQERTRDLEAARLATEAASQAKSEFLANISHELRTPLNAVIGFSDLLLRQMETLARERQQRFLTNIHVSGRRLLELVEQVLDYTEVEGGTLALQRQPLAPASALDEVLAEIRPLTTTKGQILQSEIAPDLPVLHADPARFRQICFNLLTNAVKFTPEGGTITLRAYQTAEGSGQEAAKGTGLPSAFCQLPSLVIQVTDTGTGIKAEDLPRLFSDFTQLEPTDTKVASGNNIYSRCGCSV